MSFVVLELRVFTYVFHIECYKNHFMYITNFLTSSYIALTHTIELRRRPCYDSDSYDALMYAYGCNNALFACSFTRLFLFSHLALCSYISALF